MTTKLGRKAWLVGLLTVAAMFAWWTLKVYAGHGGNWTALYCTGSRAILPPALHTENIYLFPDSWGYDGQFYHFIAHDPWLTRGLLPSAATCQTPLGRSSSSRVASARCPT